MMFKLLLIGLFGGLGSVLRYLVSGWCQRLTAGSFPVGTLAVNLIGCLVIGCAAALLLGPRLMREEYRLAILIGLLGGFTTFSSYAWESFSLLNNGEWVLALSNIMVSNALGLVAVWLGYRVGEMIWGV
jgi:CrcB protein